MEIIPDRVDVEKAVTGHPSCARQKGPQFAVNTWIILGELEELRVDAGVGS
jgi:hypothetical protein